MDSHDTENGKPLTMYLEEGEILVDDAKFVTSDIECSNCIIHIIENFFQPQLSGSYREELPDFPPMPCACSERVCSIVLLLEDLAKHVIL